MAKLFLGIFLLACVAVIFIAAVRILIDAIREWMTYRHIIKEIGGIK